MTFTTKVALLIHNTIVNFQTHVIYTAVMYCKLFVETQEKQSNDKLSNGSN